MNALTARALVTGLAGLLVIGAFFLPWAKLIVSVPPTPVNPQPVVVFESRFTGSDLAGRPVARVQPLGIEIPMNESAPRLWLVVVAGVAAVACAFVPGSRMVSSGLAVGTIVTGFLGIIMTWFRLDDFQPSGLVANFIAVHAELGLWLTFAGLVLAVVGAAMTLLAPPPPPQRARHPVTYPPAASGDDPFSFN